MRFRLTNPLNGLYGQAGIVDKNLRRDLNLFISSVSLGMVFFAIANGTPFTGFASALGADDLFFSILLAVPIAATLLQFLASWIMEKTRQRKWIFVISGLIQRVLWVPVALVPVFVPMDQPMLRKWMVIVFLTMSSVAGSFMNVTFFSWLGDKVPLAIRGRYLGIRSSIATALGLASATIASFVLDQITGLTGYVWVFGVASLFGIADIATFIWVKDTGMHPRENHDTYMKSFLGILKDKSFLQYLLFWTAWIFCWSLAGPFYAKYTLDKLHFSMTLTTLTGQVASSIMTVIFMQIWGKLLDRHGHHWVLLRCGIVACVLPLFWVFASPGSIVPVLLFSMSVGMFLSGVDLTSVQMLMTVTPTHNRSIYIALYTVFTSLLGQSLGNLVGGSLLDWMGELSFAFAGIHFDRYKVLFVATGILRAGIILLLLPLIKNIKSHGEPEQAATQERTDANVSEGTT